MSGYLLDFSCVGFSCGRSNSTISVKSKSKDLSLNSFFNAVDSVWLPSIFGRC